MKWVDIFWRLNKHIERESQLLGQLQEHLDEYDHKGESAALLSWMDKRHFTVLGLAELQ